MSAAKVMLWWRELTEDAETELPEGYQVVEVLDHHRTSSSTVGVLLLLESEPEPEFTELEYHPVTGALIDELRFMSSPSHVENDLLGPRYPGPDKDPWVNGE